MTGPGLGQMPIVRQVVAVTYSPVPVGHADRESWAVRVEWRSPAGWEVVNGRRCLNAAGEWDEGTFPRSEGWLAAHRFDYDTACTLAAQHCRQVTRNGLTADAVARRAQNPPTEPVATFGDRVNHVNWQPGVAEDGQDEQAPDPGPAREAVNDVRQQVAAQAVGALRLRWWPEAGLPPWPADPPRPEPAGDVYAEITAERQEAAADAIEIGAESATDLLLRMGTNGRRWAQEFIRAGGVVLQRHQAEQWPVFLSPTGVMRALLDEGWLIGWFANAIEAGRTAEQQPYTPAADTGDRETRLMNRICRCSRPLTELVRGCLWHDAGSAEYARDLLAEVRRLQVAVGPLMDRIDRSLPADDGQPFTAGYAQGLMDAGLWIRQAFPLSGAGG